MCLGDAETRARAVHVQAVLNTAARGAVGAAVAPELTEFLAQFLASHVPVVTDTFTQFNDMAFDFELVLFKPGDVEFLSGCASFELAGYVFVVVSDNPDQLVQDFSLSYLE